MKSGFYKKEEEDVFYAPNFVENKDYSLKIEEKDSYVFPISGWYYFETKTEAEVFFDMEIFKNKL